ncbi:unnamed protein product [Polarella glacialis]|uniref:Trafficking protein particle complex subunit 11 domain-containing protein n=1 Tax=Polarella glacialis TaxID=89957 RepID=A0A813KGP8_POLGL|nr:unnamed protein product [Polarella glacialis]
MYHRYLESHDVGAAVHHCRIHTATLRSFCANGTSGTGWRKWHWLAANHELFAELLESVAQQAPLLVDPTDVWQFPGFHYQSAAAYANRLKQWAQRAAAPGYLPPPSEAGGDLLLPPFVGQANSLERPEESGDPKQEVQLRLARQQVENSTKHAERCLLLLTKEQAACKERGYTAWLSACTARIAEGYLSEHSLNLKASASCLHFVLFF